MKPIFDACLGAELGQLAAARLVGGAARRPVTRLAAGRYHITDELAARDLHAQSLPFVAGAENRVDHAALATRALDPDRRDAVLAGEACIERGTAGPKDVADAKRAHAEHVDHARGRAVRRSLADDGQEHAPLLERDARRVLEPHRLVFPPADAARRLFGYGRLVDVVVAARGVAVVGPPRPRPPVVDHAPANEHRLRGRPSRAQGLDVGRDLADRRPREPFALEPFLERHRLVLHCSPMRRRISPSLSTSRKLRYWPAKL